MAGRKATGTTTTAAGPDRRRPRVRTRRAGRRSGRGPLECGCPAPHCVPAAGGDRHGAAQLVRRQGSGDGRRRPTRDGHLEPSERGRGARAGRRRVARAGVDAHAARDAGAGARRREAAARAGGRRHRHWHAAHPGRHVLRARGSIDNHAKSTGRLDVDAVWNEQRDDVGKDLPDDGVDGRPLAPGSRTSATSSSTATRTTARSATTTYLASRRSRRSTSCGTSSATRGTGASATTTATTRFREYFPPEIVEGRDENGERFILHGGPEHELVVPSSRRPEPPDVLYIVPTFTWEEETLSGLLSQQFLATTTGVRRRGTLWAGPPSAGWRPASRVRSGGRGGVAACASISGEVGSRPATANSWASC